MIEEQYYKEAHVLHVTIDSEATGQYRVPSELRQPSKQVRSGVLKIKYSSTVPKAPYNI